MSWHDALLSEAKKPEASPGKRIWELLPEDVKRVVEKHEGRKLSTESATQLADAVNAILRRRDFHDPSSFAEVELPDVAAEFLKAGESALDDAQVVRLNRALFDAVYPNILSSDNVKEWVVTGSSIRYLLTTSVEPYMFTKDMLDSAGGQTWLLIGETGTGKEAVAQQICQMAGYAPDNYIALDCLGLARELAQSELFGHVKGAFTGAVAERAGVFEEAMSRDCPIFIDEIGDLDPHIQGQLLRVLETWEVQRVGAKGKPMRLRPRLAVIAMQPSQTLRDDLYWRCYPNVVELPPLRERTKDVLDLVIHFVQGAKDGHRIKRIDSGLLFKWIEEARDLKGRTVHGNVRWLKREVERACAGVAWAHAEMAERKAVPEQPGFWFCEEGTCLVAAFPAGLPKVQDTDPCGAWLLDPPEGEQSLGTCVEVRGGSTQAVQTSLKRLRKACARAGRKLEKSKVPLDTSATQEGESGKSSEFGRRLILLTLGPKLRALAGQGDSGEGDPGLSTSPDRGPDILPPQPFTDLEQAHKREKDAYLRELHQETAGRVREASEASGVAENTLRRWWQGLGLKTSRGK